MNFIYLNIFVAQLAQKCSDNEGSTVLAHESATNEKKKFK